MNWKLLAGKTLNKVNNLILKSEAKFVTTNYPYGRNLIYDLKRVLPKADVIFDVGAFNGDVSIEFNNWFKTAHIYAFEPVKSSFTLLKDATAAIQQITRFNLALGEHTEAIEIPIYTEPTINTLKKAQYDITPAYTELINVTRGDDFAAQHNINSIDILKVDVEGFEIEVLKGLGNLLASTTCIIVEVGYIRCPTKVHFSDMEIFMEQNGFELFYIYDLMPFHNNRTRLSYSNNIYIRKKQS